jgi:hypothetical protein
MDGCSWTQAPPGADHQYTCPIARVKGGIGAPFTCYYKSVKSRSKRYEKFGNSLAGGVIAKKGKLNDYMEVISRQ